jgi:Eukaryotic initiation factor 4E
VDSLALSSSSDGRVCAFSLRLSHRFATVRYPRSVINAADWNQTPVITLKLHTLLTPDKFLIHLPIYLSHPTPNAAKMAEVMNPSTTTLSLDGSTTVGSINDENTAPATSSPATTASGNNVTVFHDPENFNVKHPLQNQWTLWYTKPSTGKIDNWNDLLKEVVTFDSVEEFWGVYV